MKVRQATNSDLPSTVELAKEFFIQTKQAEFAEFSYEEAQKLLEMLVPTKGLFVAETENKEIVGFAGGILFPMWLAKEHLTGQGIFWYVQPDHRKSKAGKLLSNALEKWAKESGAKSFCLTALSNVHEKRVWHTYEQKGYSPLERSYIKELN